MLDKELAIPSTEAQARAIGPTPASPDEYRQIGIVGVGAIGSGIAQLVSGLGARTVIVAPRPGGPERAANMMQACYAGDVQRGRISPEQAAAGLARIHVTERYADLSGSSFVIESVLEDPQLKLEVLRQVETQVNADCIFGTNTSSIPIAHIAAGAQRPANVIGTHYFWPAHRFKLVEIAHAVTTSQETIDRTLAFARWQGKTPLLVRDRPGFFTTRILLPYVNEAVALVVEGASIEMVDQAMVNFGWAMGPFRLMDAAGIETLARVYDSVATSLGGRIKQMERLWPVIRAGHVGYRGGSREGAKGFYLYPEGRQIDHRVYSLLGQRRDQPPPAEEVALRPVWQMVNEVGHCLAEGVIASQPEADVGAVLGLGWPRATGGPIAYARQIGPPTIVAGLEAWAERYGPRFTPSSALRALQQHMGSANPEAQARNLP